MDNKFYVWKDGIYNGKNTKWIEMSGKEFYEYVKRPENKHRLFIKNFYNPYEYKDGYYKIEVTKEAYKRWDADRKRADRTEDVLDIEITKNTYENNNDVVPDKSIFGVSLISIDSFALEDDELSYHDMISNDSDISVSIIAKTILEDIYRISRSFPKDEREILDCLYFFNNFKQNESQLAKKKNLSHQAINKKKKKILKKLKDLVAHW